MAKKFLSNILNRPTICKRICISFLLFSLTVLSCNTRFFTKSKNVIYSQKGVMVFIDNESRKFRNLGSGDVFTDSLIPDFFIPHKFPNKIVSKTDLEEIFLRRTGAKVAFVYLIRDCDQSERQSSIEKECQEFALDKNIDAYLNSNKLFVLPVDLRYIISNIDRAYYELHKELTLQYKQHSFRLSFSRGSLEVLQMDVLENDWIK